VRRRGSRSNGWLVGFELSPLVVFYSAFVLAPLGLLTAYSFFEAGLLTVHPAFQLDAYGKALTDPLFYEVLWNTILIGFATAAACVAIAYPFAFLINIVVPRYRDPIIFLVLVTLFAGYLARIYAWRTLLGAQGIVNTLLIQVGVVDEPLRFLLYSRFAVTVAMLSIYLPFAIVPLSASMQNVARETIDAARDLGAGRLTTFRTVIFPLTYGGFRAAFLFTFLLAAGDYVTPSLVGGPRPDDRRGHQGSVLRCEQLAPRRGARGPHGRRRPHPVAAVDRVLRLRGPMTARLERAGAWMFILVVLGFLFLPAAVVVLFAFEPTERLSLPMTGLSLKWFQVVLTDREFRGRSATASAAVASALLATFLGTLAAFGLQHLRPAWRRGTRCSCCRRSYRASCSAWA
jgi:spermidine/putrescine transport system permease protein